MDPDEALSIKPRGSEPPPTAGGESELRKAPVEAAGAKLQHSGSTQSGRGHLRDPKRRSHCAEFSVCVCVSGSDIQQNILV